jgi:ribose/xylose/arabinose/galactoside ABC-type transport system permease subunit
MIAAKTAEIDARFMSGVDFGVFAGVLAGGVSVYGGKGSVLGALAGVFLCTGALYMLDFIYPVSGTGALLQTAIVGIALALDARQH